jgi:hypothetical protein
MFPMCSPSDNLAICARMLVSVSGKRDLRGRDSGVEKSSYTQPIVSRDKASARKPASSALFARHREIPVCMGLRGGAGRCPMLGWIKYLRRVRVEMDALKRNKDLASTRTLLSLVLHKGISHAMRRESVPLGTLLMIAAHMPD